MSLRLLLPAVLIFSATGAAAAPLLPLSAVGLYRQVRMESGAAWRSYPILNGGAFAGTVSGLDAEFWCVDVNNYIHAGDVYFANVIPLGSWDDATGTQVRKGTISSWNDGADFSALERYQMAAYLVESYSNFPDGPASDATLDANTQKTIWTLLFPAGFSGTVPAATTSIRNAAVNALAVNPNLGFGRWAVVSGVALDSTGLLSATDRRQTFLVRLDDAPVPEPGTCALMGAGLLAVGLASRLRNKMH